MNGPFKVVIPARHASTRLPGKPLADIGGVPMIVRVARQAQAAGADEVVVATDDDRVVAATVAAGFRALMTRADHPSGSDRVMEVAERLGWNDATCVVNVQGDEPLLPPAVIACVAGLLQSDAGVRVATLCEPITDYRTLFNPNVVKVARAHNHDALYFSRAPIPFARDAFARTDFPAAPDTSAALVPGAAGALPAAGVWLRHIGIYGFRLEALRRFVALPVGALERLEALEQLRMLEHGIAIRVAETPVPVPGGVDTPEDLERVRRVLAGAAASG